MRGNLLRGPLMVSLIFVTPWATSVDIKWTPNGEGPEPASKHYCEEAARLRELQGDAVPQQQAPMQPPTIVERALYSVVLAYAYARHWAVTHPREATILAAVTVTTLSMWAKARRDGFMLTRRPYNSVLMPPPRYVRRLLERKLSEVPSTNSYPYSASKAAEKQPARTWKAVETVEVGKGELTYLKAVSVVKSLQALEGLHGVRFFHREDRAEMLWALKHRGLWTLMPMRLEGGDAEVEGPRMTEEGEVYEEVRLGSLRGCSWRGELRISANWKDPEKGGDDSVSVEVAWVTSRWYAGLSGRKKTELVRKVAKHAGELVERDMQIYKASEKQREAVAEGARQAVLDKQKKERERMLNPPPARRALNRGQGGDAGLSQWRPSEDFLRERRGRGCQGPF